MDWLDLEDHYRSGRDAEAAAGYEAALAEHPQSVWARLRLGQCRAKDEQLVQAEQLWREAIQLLEARPEALREELQRHAAGKCNLQEILPFQAPLAPREQLLLLVGEVCERQGKCPEAAASLTEILESYPRCGQALRLLHRVAWRNRDLDEAMGLAHAAILIEPQQSELLGPVCGHLIRQEHYDDAARLCELVLTHGQESSSLHTQLAKVYLVTAKKKGYSREHFDKAVDHLRRSLELQPDQPDVRALIETVEQYVARKTMVGASSVRRAVFPPGEAMDLVTADRGERGLMDTDLFVDQDPSSAESMVVEFDGQDLTGETSLGESSVPSVAAGHQAGQALPTQTTTGLSGGVASEEAPIRRIHPPSPAPRLTPSEWHTVPAPQALAPPGRSGAISEMTD